MQAPAAPAAPTAQAAQAALAAFVARHARLLVLTGAGVSTESGIPDYRDANGDWKRPQPVTYQAFTGEEATRKRYWARSLLGWSTMAHAQPGAAHLALARLEAAGRVELLLTQNVDGLHGAAGSQRVVDLHGRIDTVVCLGCGTRSPRAALQLELVARNPAFAGLSAGAAPDGDADLELADFSGFDVPPCSRCGGMLKPDVVFFGESVPRERVAEAMAALQRADAVLVVGSSLMVYSGYRFALAAAERGLPIAALNLGRTRADALLSLKVELPIGAALAALA
ncbi:NAD-dependent protein deacetylase [Pseudorhodoferax sp. Leaf274]|uniref:NAD-dependent protein deacetylase n=1 Tax=Pseudorhodoferax sp. Leaf274 TaxID=1736318 RepID=UPI000703AE57|nr:NAD-dependent protein deacetylase [Pseudorhodoferax sp. Leaf274]KQP35333.1 NAD-dependent deacetylase [Pseudorhodoferax sp. Leaf274]